MHRKLLQSVRGRALPPSMEGPLCAQGLRGLKEELASGLSSSTSCSSGFQGPGGQVSGKPLHPTLDLCPPRPWTTPEGMVMGRALSAVLQALNQAGGQKPRALCWSWGRENLAPSVCQNGFCSFPCAGPIKLAFAVCPAQTRKAIQPCGHGGTSCQLEAAVSVWDRRTWN